MNRSAWSIAVRVFASAQRGIEVISGAVLAVIGLFFSLAWFAGLVTLVTDPSQFPATWPITAGLLIIVGGIAAWCVQTGWRLMTGRERRGGGLLSPIALILIGVVCLAGSVAEVVLPRGKGFSPAALFVSALSCFSLAHLRLHPGRPERDAA